MGHIGLSTIFTVFLEIKTILKNKVYLTNKTNFKNDKKWQVVKITDVNVSEE